jgi:hypothetical protein
MKNEFYLQIFEKFLNIKFHENPSSGRRSVPCGQTDRRTDGHGEANSRFSQFCESASNGHPMTDCEGPWEGRKYSSTYSLTSVLDGVDGQRHALTTLSPGKGSGTHCRGGWIVLGLVWTGAENLSSLVDSILGPSSP